MMANDWAPQEVLIATIDGFAKVEGSAKGGLAIHDAYKCENSEWKFGVTHISTGASCGIFRTRDDALQCAEELLWLADWPTLTMAERDRIAPAAKDIIERRGIKMPGKPIKRRAQAVPGSPFFGRKRIPRSLAQGAA